MFEVAGFVSDTPGYADPVTPSTAPFGLRGGRVNDVAYPGTLVDTGAI